MNPCTKLLAKLVAPLIPLLGASAANAQPGDMMMMSMGGWGVAVCVILGILIFVALVLAIMALLKYLFGRKP
ncbi:hypothetical protein [Microbulbifer rhizosphaerae]|uniref:Putative Tic20 family protein n=1 Tax=Microbulbifer rhizosphaerae TaxID=1562603 RepID=A0A7W4Z7L4_9GAMM|nr:hypothetical protein [Microbulbifer rhizosphaerae]MBB3059878.1 putative Tic20 family protein [Microbulbifer rhizosphaerae]